MGNSNDWNVKITNARTDQNFTIRNQQEADAFMDILNNERAESEAFTSKMNSTFNKVSEEADAAIKTMALSLVVASVFILVPILNWYYSKN